MLARTAGSAVFLVPTRDVGHFSRRSVIHFSRVKTLSRQPLMESHRLLVFNCRPITLATLTCRHKVVSLYSIGPRIRIKNS